MSDPSLLDTDATSLIGHGVGALGSGGIGAWVMNFLRSKGEREMATTLALLRNDMDRVLKSLEKTDRLAERVALLEASVTAAHQRLDGKQRKR